MAFNSPAVARHIALYCHPIMKILRLTFLTLLTAVLAGAASAQTLTLDHLLKLGTLPTDVPLQKMTAALFPADWSYRGHVAQTDEVYWTANATDYEFDTETEAATSWVSLRPMPTGAMDVLFKTSHGRNFEPIRKELKRLKFPVTPVTCLECQGERYTGPNYTITLYTGKKAPYPFIVVLHQEPVDSTPARTPQLATPGVQPAPAREVTDSNLVGQTLNP